MRSGCLQHVERAVRQHFKGQPRVFGALGDADGGLVEHQVGAAGEVINRVPVPDVCLIQAHARIGQGISQVGAAPADQVVQHAHLPRSGVEQLVNDRRADGSGAAGDQYAGTAQWLGLCHEADSSSRVGRSGDGGTAHLAVGGGFQDGKDPDPGGAAGQGRPPGPDGWRRTR